jgi:hypothetical protein
MGENKPLCKDRENKYLGNLMDLDERKELRKQLLSVMNMRVVGEYKEISYKLRESTLYAIGKEFGLTEEQTREEMLNIRKVGNF